MNGSPGCVSIEKMVSDLIKSKPFARFWLIRRLEKCTIMTFEYLC